MTLLSLALIAGAATVAEPASGIAHVERLDHASGTVDARYRLDLDISHRQIGAVAPGGRAGTLRCVWQADLIVDRTAARADGSVLRRNVRHDAMMSGSRPGWCTAQREAIRREVAARSNAMQEQMIELARRDIDALRAELDDLSNRNIG
ncbi:hypothetical protein ACX40Y_06695 [Sphingomonas sp. RS6]